MAPLPQLCLFHHFTLTRRISDAASQCFEQIHAHEGTLWLLDEARQFLIPVWNSGPRASEFVGIFQQPLDAGLISLACITEQSLCENQVCLNERQDPALDQKLGHRTWAMIATPFVFHNALRGIISCVKLGANAEPESAQAPFTAENLHEVERLSERLNRLISSESPM